MNRLSFSIQAIPLVILRLLANHTVAYKPFDNQEVPPILRLLSCFSYYMYLRGNFPNKWLKYSLLFESVSNTA